MPSLKSVIDYITPFHQDCSDFAQIALIRLRENAYACYNNS